MKNKYLIITFLLLSYISYSQLDTNKTKQTELIKSAINDYKENQKDFITELDYYKLLSDQSKKENETYVSLIQWTIGISFAFLLAIIGSQIFFNYRISKKEIDFIKKDVDEKIAELKNELIENINSRFNELKKEIKEDFSSNIAVMKKEITSKFQSQKEYSELKLEVQNKSNEQKFKALNLEVEKNAGDLWKLKGVEANALSSFIRAAQLQIELGREVKYLLDDIIRILSDLEEIHEYDLNNLEILVKQTQTTNKEKSEKIKELYINKPVYKFVENSNQPEFTGIYSNKVYVKNK